MYPAFAAPSAASELGKRFSPRGGDALDAACDWTRAEGRPIQLKRFDTFEALRLDLKSALGPRDQVAFGMEVPEGLKSELENLTQYLPNLPFHDSQNGATLTAFAENDRENGLFFVTGSLKAGWTMIAIGGTFI